MIPDILTKDMDGALARSQLAGRQLEQSRLAGPIGSKQSRYARANVERYFIDPDDVAVPLRDLVEFNDRCHLRRSSDLTEKLRMPAESANMPASTPADQYHGYWLPII